MATAFNFATKRATLSGAALDVAAFYDECKLAQATAEGILFPPIAYGAGKFDLGGGRYSGLIVSLLDGWQAAFAAGSYQASVDNGTLIGGVAGQPIAYAAGVQVVLNRPADAFVVSSSGVTPADAAEAVWTRVLEAGFSAEQLVRLLAAVAAGNATGLESGAPAFKSLDGSKTRVGGTYDAGARVVTTRDGA